MKTLDLLGFAGGALRGHRLRTGLSLTGVAIGVASVILLTSLGEGARLFVTREFSALGSNLLIIISGKTETAGAAPFVNAAPNDLTVEDSEALVRMVPSVRRVAPISLGTGPVRFAERTREGTVIGTTHEFREIRTLTMKSGRFLPPGVTDEPICVLGTNIQTELFGTDNPLGEMVRIGDRRFRVIGTLTPTGTSIGVDLDEVVMIPVTSGLKMFDKTSLFRVFADVAAHHDIERARRDVVDLLIRRHGVEDVTILTQDAVLSTFNRILGALTAALAGIAAISLTVAGIGIMNVMLVSVSERTREIGLLKALGATRRQILGVFLLEASLISTAGGIIGLAAGMGAGRLLTHLVPDFPIQPPVWAVVVALVVSISVGILFGGIPARNAARLDPVEALMRMRA